MLCIATTAYKYDLKQIETFPAGFDVNVLKLFKNVTNKIPVIFVN